MASGDCTQPLQTLRKNFLLNCKYIYYLEVHYHKMLLQGALFILRLEYCPGIFNYFLKIKYKRFAKVAITKKFFKFYQHYFCTLFQVALDKSKPNQISSRESFYVDSLNVCRKANFFKTQLHSKSITPNPSLYFFWTKIRITITLHFIFSKQLSAYFLHRLSYLHLQWNQQISSDVIN